ncbi:MAG: PP0621 family protein [Pseudomonadota bacterium]
MKYLLMFGLLLLCLWFLRNKLQGGSSRTAAKKPPDPARQAQLPTEMVACAVCHVHLPRSEALVGPNGLYCSAAHRQQAS